MLADDPIEIEVKYHIADVKGAKDRILAIGGIACGRVFETNIRFEDGAKSLESRGMLLRLRKDDAVRLTFKSPPAEPDKDFKIHRELEVRVDSFNTCCGILEGLGFRPEQTYEKWRETFTLGETRILLDTMPYGAFLEIEGKKKEIRRISRQLELKWDERILLNYLEIFEIVKREADLPFNDLTFDNFSKTPVDTKEFLSLLYTR
jgi:adenylate cyclase class 2